MTEERQALLELLADAVFLISGIAILFSLLANGYYIEIFSLFYNTKNENYQVFVGSYGLIALSALVCIIFISGRYYIKFFKEFYSRKGRFYLELSELLPAAFAIFSLLFLIISPFDFWHISNMKLVKNSPFGKFSANIETAKLVELKCNLGSYRRRNRSAEIFYHLHFKEKSIDIASGIDLVTGRDFEARMISLIKINDYLKSKNIRIVNITSHGEFNKCIETIRINRGEKASEYALKLFET